MGGNPRVANWVIRVVTCILRYQAKFKVLELGRVGLDWIDGSGSGWWVAPDGSML